MAKKRATQHSGRYNSSSKHNDRNFDVSQSDHIDASRIGQNRIWNCYGDKSLSFDQVEKKAYEEMFTPYVQQRNEQLTAEGHSSRHISISHLLHSKKTMPEEIIYQIGNKDDGSISPDVLQAIYVKYTTWHNAKFGDHVRILDAALHADEASPHLHERRVWYYKDEDGVYRIGQHKALEQMGYTLPNPDAKRSRSNNLKKPYTAECRKKWVDICKSYGLEIIEEPKEYAPNEQNLKSEEYKLKQTQKKVERLQAYYEEQVLHMSFDTYPADSVKHWHQHGNDVYARYLDTGTVVCIKPDDEVGWNDAWTDYSSGKCQLGDVSPEESYPVRATLFEEILEIISISHNHYGFDVSQELMDTLDELAEVLGVESPNLDGPRV